MSIYRYAEIRQADGSFVRKDPPELRTGDVFRLFEPDGTPVSEGRLWVVTVDPKPCEPEGNCVWGAEPAGL